MNKEGDTAEAVEEVSLTVVAEAAEAAAEDSVSRLAAPATPAVRPDTGHATAPTEARMLRAAETPT